MTYSVTWKLTAIQQLDRLIAAAADPQSVRQAAAFIDTVDYAALTVTVLLVGPARRH